jgi:hypothetical protein
VARLSLASILTMAVLHQNLPSSSSGLVIGHARLDDVRTALAALPDAGLHSLRAMALQTSDIAQCLMLWIEHAAAWEIDRRAQHTYALHEPLEAIHSGDVTASILMLATLSSRFGPEHRDVRAFFRATMQCLNMHPILH